MAVKSKLSALMPDIPFQDRQMLDAYFAISNRSNFKNIFR